MKFFLDTAKLDELRRGAAWGIVDGVTANPSPLRSPTHVPEAALAGAHIATMPFKVLDMLFNHPLTDKGLDQFLKDWNKAFQPDPAGQ